MVNPSRKKGTKEETDIVNWLNDIGIRARRVALSGALDKGDIELLDFPVIIEAKNEKKMTLSEYVDEANREGDNAGGKIGIAWHKRRGKVSPGQHYVTMEGNQLVRLLRLIKS
jgi:Holliday junction resolvase